MVAFSQEIRGKDEVDRWFMLLRCLDKQLGIYERVGWFEMTWPYSTWDPEFTRMCFRVI